MGKTRERLDDFLRLIREPDLPILQALDQEIHLLLEQRCQDEGPGDRLKTGRDKISAQCQGVVVDPGLLALFGIHTEKLIEKDRILIRELISWRIAEGKS